MILILQNQTSNIKTYASGLITLPANGSVTVNSSLQIAAAVDGNLVFDVAQSNVFISDNVNTYKVTDGLLYLDRIVRIASSSNDASGNPTTSISFGDTSLLDSEGKLRVSEANSVEALYFSNSAHPLLMSNSVVGSATIALNTSAGALRLTCTTGSTDSAIAQSKRYIRYNAKGALIGLAAAIGAKKANVRQRWGHFDANNGMFFYQDSSNLAIVTRTNTSGSVVDTQVNQSSWNIDKLDGSGPSGVTLDPSKDNHYVIDYYGHGAARIRYGVFYNGKIVYCHQINNANTNTVPFIRTPSLPIRVELTNTAASASTTTLDFVYFSYERESLDSASPLYNFSASNGRTSTNVGSTTLPLIAIRPKATFNSITNRIPIAPAAVSVVSVNQPALVSVILNPTLTGASFTSADTNSAVEYDVASTAISGGTIIAQFYIAAAATGGLLGIGSTVSPGSGGTALSSILLGLDIAGSTQDVLAVCAVSTAGGTTMFAQIGWGEYQ